MNEQFIRWAESLEDNGGVLIKCKLQDRSDYYMLTPEELVDALSMWNGLTLMVTM